MTPYSLRRSADWLTRGVAQVVGLGYAVPGAVVGDPARHGATDQGLDEQGRLFLATDLGLGLVHTLDMEPASDALEAGAWPLQELPFAAMPARFGYQLHLPAYPRQYMGMSGGGLYVFDTDPSTMVTKVYTVNTMYSVVSPAGQQVMTSCDITGGATGSSTAAGAGVTLFGAGARGGGRGGAAIASTPPTCESQKYSIHNYDPTSR